MHHHAIPQPPRPATAPQQRALISPTVPEDGPPAAARVRRISTFRNNHHRSGGKSVISSDKHASAVALQRSLSEQESDAVFTTWRDVVAKNYRSSVQTSEELRALFQALHIHLLPDVEEFALQYFDTHKNHMDYSRFEDLVLQCKVKHEDILASNPLLKDDLLDAFVALGGQWDTRGALDNNKMRTTIKQYQLKIDFDRFLHLVDTDGNAEVDFDEFKKLVGEGDDFPFASQQHATASSTDNPAALLPTFSSQPPPLSLHITRRQGVHAAAHLQGSNPLAANTDDDTNTMNNSASEVVSSPTLPGNRSTPQFSTDNSATVHHPSVKPAKSGAASPGLDKASRRSSQSSQHVADSLSRLVEKVQAVLSQPPPSSRSDKQLSDFEAKQASARVFYKHLCKAVTNVADLKSFRTRCGDIMKTADRCGELSGDDEAESTAFTSRTQTLEKRITQHKHTQQLSPRQDAFLTRMCYTELTCKKGLATENKEKMIHIQEQLAARRKVLQHDQAVLSKLKNGELLDSAATSLTHFPGTAASGSAPRRGTLSRRSLTSHISNHDLAASPNSSFFQAARRRSQAVHDVQAVASADMDDDDANSVYSTSSSQRSEDEKVDPYSFVKSLRSGRSTPDRLSRQQASESQEAVPAVGPTFVEALNGSPTSAGGPAAERRRSVGVGSIAAAARAAARLKVKERHFISANPTVRLSGNFNQIRCERVRVNVEEDEAAKAKARVPQVPASKLTPRMRAGLRPLTIGEKKETCRVDEHGRERNELNTKLYECYYGRF